MGVFFPQLYPVIHRSGAYVDGVWQPSVVVSDGYVSLNIQPASASDYNRMQSTPGGRRIMAMLRAIGNLDAGLSVADKDNSPGDLVVYDDQNWLVIGVTKWDVFGNAETAHLRYLLALEAEHSSGEVMA